MRAKRTHRGHRFSSVQDPRCVKTCMSRECAELFSPVSSVDGNWQSCPFPIQRNRDRISTRKIDVGMMKSWPETVIRWHRAGFRAYWRRKSRPRGGRPKTPLEIRHLVREMSLANPLWGRTSIHGELLKLGIDVGQTTVAKYMARGRRPPSQGWKTLLHNHADGIASMDLFVVPTLSFRLLYGLLILQHDRRQILWLGVTAHPTAEWIWRQLTAAYGLTVQPRC